MLFVCSLAIPGYPLRGIAEYPTIADDYRSSIARLRGLPCDVLLGSHGSMFGLTGKLERSGSGKASPFIAPEACAAYLDRAEAELDRALGTGR